MTEGSPISNIDQQVRSLHKDAMVNAELGTVAGMQRDNEAKLAFNTLAYQLEAQAADLLVGSKVEPTRGILHRSAAELALEIGKLDEAEKLAKRGLENTSLHVEIANELKSVLKRTRGKRMESPLADAPKLNTN